MGDRIFDFSAGPARLHVRYGNLVIEREGEPDVCTPLEDLAAVVVSHARVEFTLSVLAGLAQVRVPLVVCDERYLPSGMLLSLSGNAVQAERFARQADAALPVRKRLWCQIVRAKVSAQADVLSALGRGDQGLLDLASRVRSGDTTNVEAQASRRYWPALFGDAAFRRDREAADQNRLLNYGYAVLRAVVARAICGAGLHPSLGLHHHNRYNPFCLADDLMEPFRPIVDRTVVTWVEAQGREAPVDAEFKKHLFGVLFGRFTANGEARTLFDHVARMATSLTAVFMGEARSLAIPELRVGGG